MAARIRVVVAMGAVAFACGSFSGCESQEAEREPTILRCDYEHGLQDVYWFAADGNSVRLMTVDPPRPGKLSVSDSTYSLDFPEDHPAPGYLQLRVAINRFTSKAERVIGRTHTVTHEGQTLNLEAIREAGLCTVSTGALF